MTRAPKPRKPRKQKGTKGSAATTTTKRAPARKTPAGKAPAGKGSSKKATTAPTSATKTAAGGSGSAKRAPAKKTAAPGAQRQKGLPGYLPRPDTSGPKIRRGVLWFFVVVGALVFGRWAVLAVWGTVAGLAAWQVARAWAATPAGAELPDWGPTAAAGAAVACTAAAGLGTGLGGVALIVAPLALVGAASATGHKPVSASPAVIGAVLAAVPSMSVVLVARSEQWAAFFLVVAVSFFDAGNYIGSAESSSKLEGPVTGGIGLLAVSFLASAFEAAPFDRVTAWIAGAVMVFACPLGQMLVSAELPEPTAHAPAMRRLDAYLLSAPLMFAAVWMLG